MAYSRAKQESDKDDNFDTRAILDVSRRRMEQSISEDINVMDIAPLIQVNYPDNHLDVPDME